MIFVSLHHELHGFFLADGNETGAFSSAFPRCARRENVPAVPQVEKM